MLFSGATFIRPSPAKSVRSSTPALESPRLNLTRLSDKDTHSIFNIFSNEAVIKYYDLAAFENSGQARQLIEFFNKRFDEHAGIRWGIRLRESNQLIGTCGFNTWNEKMKNAVLGYDLLPDFWGRGYGREAVHAIVQAAFSGSLPCGALHRIQADTIPGNDASEALLLNVVFKEEGLRRESGYWKNQFHDLKCFALLKNEYVEVG